MNNLETRKAELREYIEARAKSREFPVKYLIVPDKRKPTAVAWNVGGPNNAITYVSMEESLCFAANERARIAEQLLECIEALEYYANGVNWYTMKENQDSISTDDCSYIIIGEDEDGVVTSKCGGKTARKLLNKIAGEK